MNTMASTDSNRGRLGVGVLALAAVAGLCTTASARPGTPDPFASMPATITVSGIVRDFKARGTTGGHNDFEYVPTGGYGHYVNMCANTLDAEGKPVYQGGGRMVTTEWRDQAGRNIMNPRDHFPAISGDRAGATSNATGALTSASGFAQWFRDVPGVNASQGLDLTLVRQANSNRYVFNDQTDAGFTGLGGFFPINGALYGNYSNTGKNFHFTFELDTEFVYQRGTGQVFTFTGDDDVWVFVDNKCVIDIGGIHSAISQTIDLDRLSWLQSGQTYSLKFFFAERHTTQSNFRIETTLALRNVEPPTTTALHD